MKILLFGKNGQLGLELRRSLSHVDELIALSSKELDLKNSTDLKHTINDIKPNIIINASAYVAVDRAEDEPEIANQVNAQAPAVMAECAKEIGAVLIHYSTDYVFDGEKDEPYIESDTTNPLNAYGQSKLRGEQAIGQIGGAFVILRTSWVYSMRGDNFVTKVLLWARQKRILHIATDQIGSPTWARALAEVTSSIITQSIPSPKEYFFTKSGIYHLGGSGSVSRFDFARAILRLDPNRNEHIVQRVDPALTADFITPARRPLATPLNCSRFEHVFGFRLPNWKESLTTALSEYTVSKHLES